MTARGFFQRCQNGVGTAQVELRLLIELLEEAIGKRARIDWKPLQPGDVPITYADISKAQRLLNYNPQTKIEIGIRKFVDWFRTVNL